MRAHTCMQYESGNHASTLCTQLFMCPFVDFSHPYGRGRLVGYTIDPLVTRPQLRAILTCSCITLVVYLVESSSVSQSTHYYATMVTRTPVVVMLLMAIVFCHVFARTSAISAWSAPMVCTSCSGSNTVLKDLGIGIPLATCMEACINTTACVFINVALPPGNEACQLYSACKNAEIQPNCQGIVLFLPASRNDGVVYYDIDCSENVMVLVRFVLIS